ncbi:Putative peroxiredoxin [bacterium HR08]|nr:Putative peroxiredoxin [bacterium HR08]
MVGKKRFRIAVEGSLMLALALLGAGSPVGRSQEGAAPVTAPKVGDPAPDFTLPDQNNRPVRLSDFKGKKNVVLAFYVLAFTGG